MLVCLVIDISQLIFTSSNQKYLAGKLFLHNKHDFFYVKGAELDISNALTVSSLLKKAFETSDQQQTDRDVFSLISVVGRL